MIEKITYDKYLYHGRIVDLAFLQARKTELERMIAANKNVISSSSLIDCSNLESEMLEAACLFNDIKKKQIDLVTEMNEYFINELNEINNADFI